MYNYIVSVGWVVLCCDGWGRFTVVGGVWGGGLIWVKIFCPRGKSKFNFPN